MFFHRACRQTDLHQRQWIWQPRVANLVREDAVTTIQDPRIMVYEQPLPKTVDLGNTLINIIRRMGMVSFLLTAISRHSAVLSALSIQHDWQFATNHQRKPRISKLWSTVATIWPPPRRLWRVPTVPPSAVFRTRAIISRCTQSVSRTAGKQSSQSANIVHLQSCTWTSFRCI